MRSNRPAITHPELADEVDSWASSRELVDDSYLDGLSRDLRSGSDLEVWAQYDALDWLPRPRSGRAIRLANLARLVSIIRNVLIFVPVGLTWFAIGQASIAFKTYIDSGAETTANFLEFWQDGKGILDEKWRISNIATLDFQIILVLIVLSLIAGILQARSLQFSNIDNQVYEQERVDLALKIDNALFPHKVITDSSLSKTLSLLLKDLGKVSAQLESAGKNVSKTSSTINPQLKKSLSSIEQSASRVKRAATAAEKNTNSAGRLLKNIKTQSKQKK